MSYTQLIYHIVFRTKSSVPSLVVEHEQDLYRYIWGFIKNKGCILFRIGGMPDHIHLLVQLPPTLAVSDFMRDLKTATHHYMAVHKELFPAFCGWGKSYCALSCSSKEKDRVVNYIKNQKSHHQKKTFQEEVLELLRENGMDTTYFLKE